MRFPSDVLLEQEATRRNDISEARDMPAGVRQIAGRDLVTKKTSEASVFRQPVKHGPPLGTPC